jgi:hypothetical protein
MNYPLLTEAVKTGLDMPALQAYSGRLHRLTRQYVNDDGTFKPGEIPVDIADQLDFWLGKYNATKQKREQQAANLAGHVAAQKLEGEFKEQVRQLADTQRDKQAAIARLDEYERARGLIASDKNIAAITDFIQNSDELKGSKGRWSVATVDVAVAFLGPRGTNVLEFVTPKALQSSTPSSTPLPPEYLPNGEERLPLGTVPQRHHSVAQLKDLDARQRATRGYSRDGWHGGGSIV